MSLREDEDADVSVAGRLSEAEEKIRALTSCECFDDLSCFDDLGCFDFSGFSAAGTSALPPADRWADLA